MVTESSATGFCKKYESARHFGTDEPWLGHSHSLTRYFAAIIQIEQASRIEHGSENLGPIRKSSLGCM